MFIRAISTHGVGVGVGVGVGTGGAESTANTFPVKGPGAAAAPVVLRLVNGAGLANEVELRVTDAPVGELWGIAPAVHVSPFPPVNIPIAPSTRKRTGKVIAAF